MSDFTARQEAEGDKVVKSKHQQNVTRDGDFIHDFSCLIGNQATWGAGETLVGREQALIPLTQAFNFNTPTVTSRTASLPPGTPLPYSVAKMAKIIAWVGNFPRTHEDLRTPLPSHWRDLSPEVRLAFYHFAMRSTGPSYRFDLNLNAEIEKEAYVRGVKAKEFLHRRIALLLKKELGERTEFWFVMEENDKHRLHIHGGISISENQRKAARLGLRRAGGIWHIKEKQFQLSMKPRALNPDLRGSCYAGKNLQWSVPARRRLMNRLGGYRKVPLFRGKALSVTRQILRDARILYEQARQLVIDYRNFEKLRLKATT